MRAKKIRIILIESVVLTALTGAVGQAGPQTAQATQTPETSVPTPEHISSTLKVVTNDKGELSIVAFNCTMREVLEMVRSKTGAMIDVPPSADERVFVELGPGPAHAVLDSLLEGSDFNYVIVWPESDSRALTTVALYRRLPAATEETSPVETADLGSERATGTETVRYQEITQAPPAPIQEAPEAAQAVNRLAASVVHRASLHP